MILDGPVEISLILLNITNERNITSPCLQVHCSVGDESMKLTLMVSRLLCERESATSWSIVLARKNRFDVGDGGVLLLASLTRVATAVRATIVSFAQSLLSKPTVRSQCFNRGGNVSCSKKIAQGKVGKIRILALFCRGYGRKRGS